jgi:uncharacterized RDD family membrane protein YckC
VNIKNPPLIRVYGSLVYELFALVPIWMIAGFIFVFFFDTFFGSYQQLIFQIYLWFISGFYLTYCWTKSGQTLAMMVWKLKLISPQGRMTRKLAWRRYIYATLGTLMGGVSFLWALTNKKHYYLHDQILKCYFIDVRFCKSSSPQPRRK